MILVDLKTTKDASPEGFRKEAWKYHYHVSAAFSLDGVQAVTGIMPQEYIFVCVEPGFNNVAVYRSTPEFIEEGRRIYQETLKRFKECQDTNRWPGYSDSVLDLHLPKFLKERKQL